MSDRKPTLQEAINLAVQYGMRRLYTCIPAKVVKYDAAKQKVDVQILIRDAYEDEAGARVVESWPVVASVPVQFMGAGGYRMTFPISDGGGGSAATTGTLFFCHRSMDKWLSGSGAEVDPEFDHDHALTDAVFMPGLNPFGAPWQSCPADSASFGSDSDGNGRVNCKTGSIELGDGATENVVTKKDLQALYAAINGAGVVPMDGGAAFKAALLAALGLAGWSSGAADGQMGSSKVKAVR